MRIGIAGIAGRVGRLLAEEVVAAGATLAGGTMLPGETAPAGASIFTDAAAMAASSDVLIDFTHVSAVSQHAAAFAAAGKPWVLGTTGLGNEEDNAIIRALADIPIVRAANFSPGVTVLLSVAEQLGRVLPAEIYDAEILEMHHRQKVDAPSGTALSLGHAVARGRGVRLPDVWQRSRDGETGARKTGEIGFAALRGGQVVGDHSIIFAAADEQIVLTHHAFDRRSFAKGAVQAAIWVFRKPAKLYSMRDVLGLV
jgi:4-hydroxy-tetrahydrodipicolinate reductase